MKRRRIRSIDCLISSCGAANDEEEDDETACRWRNSTQCTVRHRRDRRTRTSNIRSSLLIALVLAVIPWLLVLDLLSDDCFCRLFGSSNGTVLAMKEEEQETVYLSSSSSSSTSTTPDSKRRDSSMVNSCSSSSSSQSWSSLLMDDSTSSRNRAMVSSLSKQSTTKPSDDDNNNRNIIYKRAGYTSTNHHHHQQQDDDENDNDQRPNVCLAFLSCCNRIDLLNHTMYGAIRHMEEDEPSFLRYEIAWVDNGSNDDLTSQIKTAYEMEHVVTFQQNMGLAYGMNLLVQNLCTAPYILLLEEDWLYLDDIVAPQTPQRRRSVATSIALIEHLKRHSVTSFDGRNVMGVFLRHESYDTFLTFPYADNWEEVAGVDLQQELRRSLRASNDNDDDQDDGRLGRGSSCTASDNENVAPLGNDNDENEGDLLVNNGDDSLVVDIDYRIFCADVGLGKQALWGSYTNGAGLYRRADLIANGRMYGEPGDAFHDRYTEGNFAYRIALRNCHAAIRLTDDKSCDSIYDVQCTGAFHHIGGGRSTRPRTAKDTKCEDVAWNFLGTPIYDKYRRRVAQVTTGRDEVQEICSPDELQELRERRFRDTDSEAYREQVRRESEELFREEALERQKIRDQATFILQLLANDPEALRAGIPWMKDLSETDIRSTAIRMRRLADSPHPLEGYFDMHGRPAAAKAT